MYFWDSPSNVYRQRRNAAAFRAVIKNPVSAGPLTTVAGARLAFKAIGALPAGQSVVITGATTRTITLPAMQAGDTFVLDWAEKGSQITFPAGIDVMVDTGLNNFQKVAGV